MQNLYKGAERKVWGKKEKEIWLINKWHENKPLAAPMIAPSAPKSSPISWIFLKVLGKINKAATLNFNFFERGSDVIEEESPYKPDPVLLREIIIHLDL